MVSPFLLLLKPCTSLQNLSLAEPNIEALAKESCVCTIQFVNLSNLQLEDRLKEIMQNVAEGEREMEKIKEKAKRHRLAFTPQNTEG